LSFFGQVSRRLEFGSSSTPVSILFDACSSPVMSLLDSIFEKPAKHGNGPKSRTNPAGVRLFELNFVFLQG